MKSLTQQLLDLQKIIDETKTTGDINSLALAIAIKAYNLGWNDVYDNIEIAYDHQYPFIETNDVPGLIEL